MSNLAPSQVTATVIEKDQLGNIRSLYATEPSKNVQRLKVPALERLIFQRQPGCSKYLFNNKKYNTIHLN